MFSACGSQYKIFSFTSRNFDSSPTWTWARIGPEPGDSDVYSEFCVTLHLSYHDVSSDSKLVLYQFLLNASVSRPPR